MAKKTIVEASSDIYKLLESFEPDERLRLIRGVLVLFGDERGVENIVGGGARQSAAEQQQRAETPSRGGERKYFKDKSPQGTLESLAVAAALSEAQGGAPTLNKDDFKVLFSAARHNFPKNFARDMDNAKRAGYFNSDGSKKNGYTLSAYGQDYVDQLPDRAAAKAVVRPKGGARGKKRRKGGQKTA